MMRKYELTISCDYVKDWTYLEAVREFFQNAIDEESSNPSHKMNYSYDMFSEILTIENSNSYLDVDTLLLGKTSKSNNEYIGSFGEGYKIGILVLLRSGKEVTIYNGPDLWKTRLVNSRRYNSVIPVIEVYKNHDKNNSSLIVEIAGITNSEYDKIVHNNIRLKEDTNLGTELDIIETEYGDLIRNKSESGRVYVGGLFVCEDFELEYGYNLNPKYVNLNRDRNMISSFDLIWNTSRIIANAFNNDISTLLQTLDCKDTGYIETFIKRDSKESLIEYFKEKHKDRIPVTSQEEFDYFKSKGMNPIIVKEKVKTIIGSSYYANEYKEYEEKDSLYNRMSELIDSLEKYVVEDGMKYFESLKDYISDYEDDLSEIEVDD